MNNFNRIFSKKVSNHEKSIIYNNKNSADECPNCKVKLKKIPTKKTICKNCGNYIYVRKDYLSKKTFLLTEA